MANEREGTIKASVTDYLTGYLDELDNYMDRLNSNRLSRNDQKLFMEISREYYKIFDFYHYEDKSSFPKELLEKMTDFNGNIISDLNEIDIQQVNALYKEIKEPAEKFRDGRLRLEFISGVFQKESAILRMHEEQIAILQSLVTLELKMGNELTQETLATLDAFHCEVINGKVRELREWEMKEQESVSQENQDIQEEKEERSNTINIDGKEYRIISGTELDQMLAEQMQKPEHEREVLDLSNCYIENYIFKGDLKNISFDNAHLKSCEFRMTKSDHVSFENTTLNDCDLRRADFAHCSFKKASFDHTDLTYGLIDECSFEEAVFNSVSMESCNFYRTSFHNAHMNHLNFHTSINNVFFRCKNDTVVFEAPGASAEEHKEYTEKLKALFDNEGYSYDTELVEDPESDSFKQSMANGEVQFIVKISEGDDKRGVETLHCTAKVNPETLEILDVDSSAFDQKTAKMFAAEAREKLFLQTRIYLRIPRMTRDEFKETTGRMKANGARFDAAKKQWYIMPDNKKKDFFRSYMNIKQPAQRHSVQYQNTVQNVSFGETDRKEAALETATRQDKSGMKEEASYRAYAYMKGNDQKPKPLYGKNPEEILSKLQQQNKNRAEDMKLRTCYIQKLNTDIGKFENIGKYDVMSGKDITPIYLKIPHVSDRNIFNNLVASLKAKGARYNQVKKAFYITKQDDVSQFAEYLPADILSENKDFFQSAEQPGQTDDYQQFDDIVSYEQWQTETDMYRAGAQGGVTMQEMNNYMRLGSLLNRLDGNKDKAAAMHQDNFVTEKDMHKREVMEMS